MELTDASKKNLSWALLALLVTLSLFLAVKFLSELRAYGRTGGGEIHTISVSGQGEIKAIPDVAVIYFTIREEGATVKEAQNKVAEVERKVLEYLRANQIAERDIRTESASFHPKYEYVYDSKILAPCSEWGCPPRPGKNVVSGYQAYESINLKVRNLDEAGKIIEGLGALGVSELSGPGFMIDDEEGLKLEARRRAIKNAKEEAKILAKDLGVRLGRVASFSESGGYPIPFYERAEALALDAVASPKAAELPRGENTITSFVTITYEIR